MGQWHTSLSKIGQGTLSCKKKQYTKTTPPSKKDPQTQNTPHKQRKKLPSIMSNMST